MQRVTWILRQIYSFNSFLTFLNFYVWTSNFAQFNVSFHALSLSISLSLSLSLCCTNAGLLFPYKLSCRTIVKIFRRTSCSNFFKMIKFRSCCCGATGRRHVHVVVELLGGDTFMLLWSYWDETPLPIMMEAALSLKT